VSPLQTGRKAELSITEKVISRKSKGTAGDTHKRRWEIKCYRYTGLTSSIKTFIYKGIAVDYDTTKVQMQQYERNTDILPSL